MNISTRQLHAFITLARECNFTRAAAFSHMSQPAFSALIRQLEDAVGVRLFDRTTRHVELTAEGTAFEASARRVLDDVDAALSDMRERAARKAQGLYGWVMARRPATDAPRTRRRAAGA